MHFCDRSVVCVVVIRTFVCVNVVLDNRRRPHYVLLYCRGLLLLEFDRDHILHKGDPRLNVTCTSVLLLRPSLSELSAVWFLQHVVRSGVQCCAVSSVHAKFSAALCTASLQRSRFRTECSPEARYKILTGPSFRGGAPKQTTLLCF